MGGGGVHFLLKWLNNFRECFLNSRLNYCVKHLNSNTLFVFLSNTSCSTAAVLIKIFETCCNCAAVQNIIYCFAAHFSSTHAVLI